MILFDIRPTRLLFGGGFLLVSTLKYLIQRERTMHDVEPNDDEKGEIDRDIALVIPASSILAPPGLFSNCPPKISPCISPSGISPPLPQLLLLPLPNTLANGLSQLKVVRIITIPEDPALRRAYSL